MSSAAGSFDILSHINESDLPSVPVSELDEFLTGTGLRVLRSYEEGSKDGVYVVRYVSGGVDE